MPPPSLSSSLYKFLPWNELSFKKFYSPIIGVTAKVGCAINCKYCPQSLFINSYYSKDKNRKSEMSFDDFKNYIDKMPANAYVSFGGFVEPFFTADSIKMMEYVVQTGRECELCTTFRGLSLEDFDRLVKIPFDHVLVHTPDKYGHAKIPMTDEYLAVFKKAVVAKKPNGKDFIDDANCQLEPHPDIVKIVNGKFKIEGALFDRAGNLGKDDTSIGHVTKTGIVRCNASRNLNHFILLPDGSLALCCNDWGLEHVVGNLAHQTYQEVMQGEPLRYVIEQMEENGKDDFICRQCWFAV